MKTQLLKIYQLLDVVKSLKEDIIVATERSVNLFTEQKDDPSLSTKVSFDVVTMNDEEYPLSFETKPVDNNSICSTIVSFDGSPLGVFRFDDGDFDAEGNVKEEVQDFILQFILTELKHRKLQELFSPALCNCSIYDLSSAVHSVGEVISQFGLEVVVIEGSTISTLSIINREPYNVLASSTVSLYCVSSHISALLSITLIELAKAVICSLFDKNELTVVD